MGEMGSIEMRQRDLKVGKFYEIVCIGDKSNPGQPDEYIGAGMLVKKNVDKCVGMSMHEFDLGFENGYFSSQEIVSERKDLPTHRH
jgi:hypothetical protein